MTAYALAAMEEVEAREHGRAQTRDYFRLQFPSHKRNVSLVRNLVYRLCLDYGLSMERAFDMKLVCGEALINIIKHAYSEKDNGAIFLELYRRKDHIELRLRDLGLQKPIQSDMVHDLSDYREKGLGLFLITKLSDYHYFDQSAEKGTLLVIKKRSVS